MAFICISLITSDVEYLFMCLFDICTSSVLKDFLRSFGYFVIELVDFFPVEFCEFLIYSRYWSFVGYMVCRYFLLVHHLSFILLTSHSQSKRFVFFFTKVSLSFFLLWIVFLVLSLKTFHLHMYTIYIQKFPFIYFSRSFIEFV